MNWIKIFVCGVFLGGSLVCSERSFLIKEKAAYKKSLPQLRNEATKKMGELVERLSKEIEKLAHLQTKLCKELKKSLEGSKSSVILKGSQKDLQKILQEIAAKQIGSEKELVESERLSGLLTFQG